MFNFVFIIGGDTFQSTDRNRLFVNASAPTSRLAWAVACSAEDPGKHIGIPVDHVRLGVSPSGDQADVFGNRRMRGARVLAVDDLMKILGILYVSWFHFTLLRV